MAVKTKLNICSLMWSLVAIVIVFCVSLSVGTTFARYSTQITGDMGYKAENAASPYIVDFDENGDRVEFEPVWLPKGGEKYLTLTVSNCNVGQDEAPSADAVFRIRVFVPEDDFGDISIGNLAMTLQVGNNPTVFYSEADYLSTQTPMYAEKSENGWFFSFYENFVSEDGSVLKEEVVRTLKGGEVSDIQLTLTVQNTEIDCSSFNIFVDRL